MANDVRTIILPTDAEDPTTVLSSLFSEVSGSVGAMVRDDGETFAIILADSSNSGLRSYDARSIPDGTTAILAIGLPDRPPSGGTFSLSYDGVSTNTAAIPANPTAAELQTALNSNPSRFAAGPVTVLKEGADYRITDTDPGVRSLLGANGAFLIPLSSAAVRQYRAGTADGEREIQILSLRQAAYATQTAFDPLPAAGYTLSTVQAGVADVDGTPGVPAIQLLTLDPAPYGGTLTVDSKIIPFDATEQAFANAYGGGVSVSKAGDFAWQFTQGSNGSRVSTVSIAKLLVPKGFLITLNLSTFEFLFAFSQLESTEDSFLAYLSFRVTFPGKLPKTYLRRLVEIFRSVINPDALVSATLGIGYLLNLPARTFYASRNGAALDSDLVAGGGTDDTAALQAILDLAPSLGRLELVMDGPARVTGLDVWSNTIIRCLPGAGFYLADSVDRPILRNKHPSRTTRTDSNIELIGGFYNGNGYHQNRQAVDNTFVVGLGFYGVTGLRLSGVTVKDARTFAYHFSNCPELAIEDCFVSVDPDNPLNNQDGLHINGPGDYPIVRNFRGTSNDDFVSICADDGAGDVSTTNELGPLVGKGAIRGAILDGIYPKGALFGIRLLSKTSALSADIRNFRGTTQLHYLEIQPFEAGQPGAFDDITIQNMSVQALTSVGGEPYEIVLGGAIRSLKLSNPSRRDPQSVPQIQTLASLNVQQLEISGWSLIDLATGYQGGFGQINVLGGNIDVLALRNVVWTHPEAVSPGAPGGSLVGIGGTSTTVGQLILEGISTERLDGMVAVFNGATVGSIRGVSITNADPLGEGDGEGVLKIFSGLPSYPSVNFSGVVGSPLITGTGEASVTVRTGDAF